MSYKTLLRQRETSAVVRLRESLMQPFHVTAFHHSTMTKPRQEPQDTHTHTEITVQEARHRERQFKRQKARYLSHLTLHNATSQTSSKKPRLELHFSISYTHSNSFFVLFLIFCSNPCGISFRKMVCGCRIFNKRVISIRLQFVRH